MVNNDPIFHFVLWINKTKYVNKDMFLLDFDKRLHWLYTIVELPIRLCR